MTKKKPTYYTAPAVAHHLNVSTSTVYNAISKGRLRAAPLQIEGSGGAMQVFAIRDVLSWAHVHLKSPKLQETARGRLRKNITKLKRRS